MNGKRNAIVFGASGSVGAKIIEALLASGEFRTIVTLVRQPQLWQVACADRKSVDLRQILLPTMDPRTVEEATRQSIKQLEGEVVSLSALGVGAGTAKLTLELHRSIDVRLNAAFATPLHASGRVRHLAFLSAVGANAAASTKGSGVPGLPRYARVKGEAEAEVCRYGPKVVSIFRPAMIIGSQHTPYLLGKVLCAFSVITPARYKPISAHHLATAMVATSRFNPVATAIYHHPEIRELLLQRHDGVIGRASAPVRQ